MVIDYYDSNFYYFTLVGTILLATCYLLLATTTMIALVTITYTRLLTSGSGVS